MSYNRLYEYLDSARTIPQNTNVSSSDLFIGGDTNGSLVVRTFVKTAMTIAATKAITIALYNESDDSLIATIYSATASGTSLTSVAVGTQLGEDFVLPNGIDDTIYSKITTTDASAAGKLDIVIGYQAR